MAEMLLPATVLIVWSIAVMLWMVVSRMPAMGKLGVSLNTAKAGGRGQDLEGKLPPDVMWKSHNYTHLMEQPTIFYPAVIAIALLGPATLDVALAWLYVVLRILHSLWQALVNTLPVRFSLFAAATICLLVLALRAMALALGSGDLA